MHAAIEVIGGRGYAATSVADICAAAGLARSQFYSEFANREALLVDVYDLIQDDALAAVVRSSAAGYSDPGTPSGCFVLSEPRLAERRRSMEDVIAARIERGIAEGDVPAGTDAARTAAFVVAVLTGMSTQARDGGSAARVAEIGELALAALPRP